MKKCILSLALASSAFATDQDIDSKPTAVRQHVQALKQGMVNNKENIDHFLKLNSKIQQLNQAKVQYPHLKDKIDLRIKQLREEKSKVQEEGVAIRETLKSQVKAMEVLKPQPVAQPTFIQRMMSGLLSPIQWLWSKVW